MAVPPSRSDGVAGAAELRLSGPQRRGRRRRVASPDERAVLGLDVPTVRPAPGTVGGLRDRDGPPGCASSASIVSSPWIVDSAPELWLTVPSRGDPVEGDAGGRVVGRGVRGVGAEEPGGARRRRAGRPPLAAGRRSATAPGSRRRRRSGCASIRVGSRPLSGPPEVSIHGSKVNESRGRRAAPGDAVAEHVGGGRPARPASARTRRASRERDSAQGSTPPNGQCRASPPESSGDAVAEPRQGVRAARRCRRRGRRPRARARPRRRRRRRRRSATPGCGGRRSGGSWPYVVEHLPVERARPRGPAARWRKRAKAGSALLERGVALAERPERCGPASRTRRCRTGRAAPSGRRCGFRVPSGCIHSTTLPAFGAGRGLQVGQAAQHLVRRVAAVTSSRSAASGAGRRPRRGPCRRR